MMFFKKKHGTQLPFRAYSGAEPYAFVSYARADSDTVYPIIKALYDRDILMWYDEGIDVGAEWSQKIADRIINCSKLILFISPASIKSHHVRQEINFANGKHKQILPVYIKPTKLNAGMEMTLSVFQAIYRYAYKDDDRAFFSQLYKSLTEGFLQAGSEITQFRDFSGNLLQLDEHGDKSLPSVIHLPARGVFTVGRFDIMVGVRQSDFEFGKDTPNVSRRHAMFECTEAHCTVTDLGSKGGTWINGQLIPPNISHILAPGCGVSFGNAGANYRFK
jgi:hypothetical protein